MKKKKVDIIKLDADFSFEDAMRRLANVKAEDVDEVMHAEECEDLEIEDEESEPQEEF